MGDEPLQRRGNLDPASFLTRSIVRHEAGAEVKTSFSREDIRTLARRSRSFPSSLSAGASARRIDQLILKIVART